MRSAQNFILPYEKPPFLLKLEQFQQEGQFDLDVFNFAFDYNHAYWATPIDSIQFCTTGGDGCHFAFLTDFGTWQDLENAPIVFVAPMDFGECVRLVANNLKDLLGLFCYFGYTEAFRFYRPDSGELENIREQIAADSYRAEDRKILCELLYEEFGAPRFEHSGAYDYVRQVQEQRATLAQIPTLDTIGILGKPAPNFKIFDFKNTEDTVIETFLRSASRFERLKFYRDFKFLKGFQPPETTRTLIGQFLEVDGLLREARTNLTG